MAARYLTSRQVTQQVEVSKGTVRRAVQTGELRAALQLPGGAFSSPKRPLDLRHTAYFQGNRSNR